MSTQWTADQMSDLTGKSAVVTGGNSGIGLETVRELARAGARVVLAARNLEKGEAALADVRATVPSAQVELAQLDLASLASIRQFAAAMTARMPVLDLLINNAGVMAIPYRQTEDGFEMHFGTNHLGHFALTGLLLDALLRAPAARIVTVSSGMHRRATIDFDNLQWQRDYDKWRAYGRTKLANLLFAFELQRRLEATGARAISVAAHPGYTATNLQLVGPQMEGSRVALALVRFFNRIAGQSAVMGALPILYAATAEDVRGGDYIGSNGLLEMRGYPTHVKAAATAHDEAVAARLWHVSAELTGVSYPQLAQSPVEG